MSTRPQVEERPDGTIVVEAETPEAAISAVRDRLGPDARISTATRTQRGGLGGFFAKELYRVVASSPTPAEPESGGRGTVATGLGGTGLGGTGSADTGSADTGSAGHGGARGEGESGGLAEILRRVENDVSSREVSFGQVLRRELAAKGVDLGGARSQPEPAEPEIDLRDHPTGGGGMRRLDPSLVLGVAAPEPRTEAIPAPDPDRVVDLGAWSVLGTAEEARAAASRPQRIQVIDPLVEPEPEPEPVVGAEPVVEPEPLVEPEPVVGAEPVVEPEPVVDVEPLAEPEPEPVVEPEPLVEQEPLVEPEPEPVVGAGPLVEPEPVDVEPVDVVEAGGLATKEPAPPPPADPALFHRSDAAPGTGGVAWDLDRLSRLGLPFELIDAVVGRDPADDLGWLTALAGALDAWCGPLPEGASVMVGPRATDFAGALGVPAVEFPDAPPYGGTVCLKVRADGAGRAWLSRVRGDRWLHVVVGRGSNDLLGKDPGAISFAGSRWLVPAICAASERGVPLGYQLGPDGVARCTPFELALGLRALMGRR